MKKKIICLVLLIVCIFSTIVGCTKNTEEDANIIYDGIVNVGVLLPTTTAAKEISSGLSFAYSLANTIYLDENIKINISEMYYNDVSDVKDVAKDLINQEVSSIVFYGDSPEISREFEEAVKDTKIPVVSINPANNNSENMFSIGVSPMYISSCAATYALENNYKKCAVIVESDGDYYSKFADTYKSTLYSYCNVEPTVYYVNGESANYTPSVLSSGNYEYVLLAVNSESREDIVYNLRSAGFLGEIMLAEIIDKASVNSETFNNCSFVSKLEEDNSNNISTVFYSMYSEFSGITQDKTSAAAAYGYDAYMIIFEAIKSFSINNGNAIFEEITSTQTKANEIKGSDLCRAIKELTYYGVTDKITFSQNCSVPTYIYVDNIINGEAVFANKYTFSSSEH